MRTHGKRSTYTNGGCRCKDCRDAQAAYCRMRQRELTSAREQNRVKSSRYRDTLREYIIAEKSKPCTDCGVQYPYYVMQFDHLRDKEFNIARSNRSLIKIKAEIAKCELVCANCHAERTHKRQKGIDFL